MAGVVLWQRTCTLYLKCPIKCIITSLQVISVVYSNNTCFLFIQQISLVWDVGERKPSQSKQD